ncbi:ROK family protein [Terriglobus sp. TAA 43]|uniref:ROK family protein n=1 Tax=Terriglobus sp. TAA 43 TaxID=278961 RepID=UPI000648EAD5|nr:ROK family protein [Terriglobus sp. TAA 43]
MKSSAPRQNGTRPMRGIRRIDLASVQPASSEIARDINRDIILELIRFKQPLARADLSRLSGLRPSTVSKIVEQLVQENWVQEGAVIKAARGRPSTMLSVNSAMVTFALDLRPDRAILAVVDLSGRFLSRETIPTYSDLARTVAQIGKRMRALREEHSTKSFEGVGVSVPGRMHPATQRVVLAPNMKWHDFDLKSALEIESGLQVEIDNDANVCLISELWYGRLEGVKNVVLVAVAEGVGAAILAGGHMQSGYNGLAGEFGHVSVDPAGPQCQCGQNGCWEMVSSSRAAIRYYNAGGRKKVQNIYELLRQMEDGDALAREAITEQARALGRGLRMVTATLSPELILVVGDITAAWDLCGPIIEREMSSSMLAGDPPQLRAAGDAELARLSGGAAMLMQRHAGYHRSTHERALPIPA